MNKILLFILLSFLALPSAQAQVISKSFEMRYFTDSTYAMGTIDFKGDSSIFSLEQRVQALQKFLQYSKNYFQDKELDVPAVPYAEYQSALAQVKQLPQPEQRERLLLNRWEYVTNKQGLRAAQEEQIRSWTKNKKASITNGKMYAMKNFEYTKKFELQEGRFTLEWQTEIPKTKERSAFLLLDSRSNPVVLIGINSGGECFYKSRVGLPINVGKFERDTSINFKVFVDVESNRFSLWLNGEEKANFVRTLSENPISKLFLKLPLGATLDNIYGLRYEAVQRPADPQLPIPIPKGSVFLDERFEFTEEIGDLELTDLDAIEWKTTTLPLAANDRFRDSDLLLNKFILAKPNKKTLLQAEYLSEGAEIWLNNRILYIQPKQGNLTLDLSEELNPDEKNRLLIRFRAGDEGHLQAAWIDYLRPTYIESINVAPNFASTQARLQVKAKLKSEENTPNGEWSGRVSVQIYPWLPNESTTAISSQTFPVRLRSHKTLDFSELLIVPNPNLWSLESPNLYRVVVSLVNKQGRIIDDVNTITGFRTIEQTNGTFHLNGEPMLLHGANWADYVPFPIGSYEQPTDITADWLVRNIASIKALNGNVLRISEKHKINKTLLAQLCDQLGLFLIYQTENERQPWKTNFTALQNRIQTLQHHPSIIMWQGADNVQFSNYSEDAAPWMKQYRETIRKQDTTRLIALTGTQPSFGTSGIPNDNGSRLYDPNYRRYRLLRGAGAWLADDVVRVGNDPALSYGRDWNSLRQFPEEQNWDTLRLNYLRSDQHIYIDFHSESLVGQENPRTVKGSPYRYSDTYASPYVASLLSTDLVVEDWILTQAWQGFAGYEAYRKKRWLGYDGLLWSSLMNSADPSSLLDASGYLKLGAYMAKMAAQPTLAGSYNTDVAYSTGEYVPVFLTHIGNAVTASVKVTVKDVIGTVLQSSTIPAIMLPSGNYTFFTGEWQSNITERGWYIVEYEVRRR